MLTAALANQESGSASLAGVSPHIHQWASITDSAVIAELTHKRHADNVWIGGLRTCACGDLCAEFQLPPMSSAFRLAELIEIQRQAGIAHAHLCLNVPAASVFVLNQIALSRSEGSIPSGGTVEVTTEGGQSQGRTRAARQGFRLQRGERASDLIAIGSSEARFIERAAFDRLRTAPSAVAYTPTTAVTVPLMANADAGDPLLNDHDSDHVSAMALITAIERALGGGANQQQVTGLSIRFVSYAEHRAGLVRLHLTLLLSNRFTGLIEQNGWVRAEVDGVISAGVNR